VTKETDHLARRRSQAGQEPTDGAQSSHVSETQQPVGVNAGDLLDISWSNRQAEVAFSAIAHVSKPSAKSCRTAFGDSQTSIRWR
jgi:hypothetical protein